MKHVTNLSKESLPARALFVIEVDNKSDCKDVEPYGDVDACKERVKAGLTYTYVIPL